MINPYATPEMERRIPPSTERRRSIVAFCLIAYALHVVVLWGVACFHDAHTGSALRQPFATISATYGWKGLLGVALIYAVVPVVIYFLYLMIANYFVVAPNRWSKVMSVAQWSISPGLLVDGVLGIPLFTTG